MLPVTRTVVRRDGGIYALERALQRRGFALVAGADEAGRGACAGPLVVAAAILPASRGGEITGLTDSKLLSPATRERIYGELVGLAVGYAVVVIPAEEVDRRGLHVCNLAGMRRALAALSPQPHYVLTDGFPVDGLGRPGLAVWKGDQVAACVAAASILAKVSRDRIMVELAEEYPDYGFAEHKGYATDEHSQALVRHGPCPQHRLSYANVGAVLAAPDRPEPGWLLSSARGRRRSSVSGVTVDDGADAAEADAGTAATMAGVAGVPGIVAVTGVAGVAGWEGGQR